jgi:hypothetical protein
MIVGPANAQPSQAFNAQAQCLGELLEPGWIVCCPVLPDEYGQILAGGGSVRQVHGPEAGGLRGAAADDVKETAVAGAFVRAGCHSHADDDVAIGAEGAPTIVLANWARTIFVDPYPTGRFRIQ